MSGVSPPRSNGFANDTRRVTQRAAVEKFALRLIFVASPFVLDVMSGPMGYVALAAIAGAAQFAGSARSAFREQAFHEAAYRKIGETLARASAMVPLPLPEVEPELALGRAFYAKSRLTTDTLPALYGEAVALLCAMIVVALSPYRAFLVPLAFAALVAMIAYLPFRRVVREREDSAQKALVALHSLVMLFLSERVERVAQGADTAFLADLRQQGHAHRGAARIATAGRTLLRRVPLALATIAATLVARAMHITTLADAPRGLMALAIIAGASALLSSLADRAQLEVDSSPFDALLALRDASLGGHESLGPCGRIVGRDISYSYDSASTVVTGFSFEVARGKPLVLRGENGSGKSTLLKLVLGLGTPTSGEIEVDDKSLRAISMDSWRSQIAFVAQATPFDANADVRDAMRAIDSQLNDDALMKSLAALGLDPPHEWLTKKMGALSSGQRRRVQLARAFALDRRVLVLDEPEAGLDAATQKRVRDLVLLASQERLVVIATHSDLFDEGIRLAPRA